MLEIYRYSRYLTIFPPIELKTLLALDQNVNCPKPKSPHYTITMPRYYTHGKITNMKNVKALIFDVFGTVVDWRTSVIDECLELAKANNIHADWGQFADAWRAKYGPFMNKVRTKELPWTNLDRLHRMALDELLSEFHINTLTKPLSMYSESFLEFLTSILSRSLMRTSYNPWRVRRADN